MIWLIVIQMINVRVNRNLFLKRLNFIFLNSHLNSRRRNMSDVDFKQVKRINQRNKDIVYGYIKQFQQLFPEDNPYYTIVQLIQDICLLYFTILIESKILTDEEKIKLMEMVNNHTNNKFNGEWKLLFRGSRDGYKRQDFYKKCNKMDNTICVIHTVENNVFGGYTSIKWDKSDDYHETDRSAFIYKIRNNGTIKPILFPAQNNGKYSVQQYSSGYLSFGKWGKGFYFNDMGYQVDLIVNYGECPEYNLEKHELNGHSSTYVPIEVEVFRIQSI